MNIVIITGASSGMGRETAYQLDKILGDSIDEFWLISRRLDRLKDTALLLKHKSYLLPMDLSDKEDIKKFKLELDLHTPKVRMLVNASGFGVLGDFNSVSSEDEEGMVLVNCLGLTSITRYTVPFMKRGSRIINFASSAAFIAQPGFSVYAASKSYVLSLSKALNTELSDKRIYVTAVCPGPVNTEFFDIAEKHGSTLPIKKYFMADPSKVVRQAIEDSYHKRSLSIYSIPMKLFYLFTKYFPEGIILKIIKLMKEKQV